MKYAQFINELISKEVSRTNEIVIFGQNVAAGSYLSGLTADIKTPPGGLIINTPNCENSLCGIGFGLMISGVSSIFFIKQQDFLLLGIDHLVNTYNLIRHIKPAASFTIVAITVDGGYEGAQSGLNNFADFCSIARADGFTVTNKTDAQAVIKTHLITPGFRILGVSQRLFKQDVIDCPALYSHKMAEFFQYEDGSDATIVCFNFSFPYGSKLYGRLKEKGVNASFFSVNAVRPVCWDSIIENIRKTKRLIIIDDSKSENLPHNDFLVSVLEACELKTKLIIKRRAQDITYTPNPDCLIIEYDKIADMFKQDMFEKGTGNERSR